MNRLAISSTFAILGVTALFMISSWVEPHKIELKDLHKYEGQKVIVEGIVKDIRLTTGGNTIILITDGYVDREIFAYGKKEIFIGDTIKVKGTVQRYQDFFEIIADDIHVVESKCIEIELWQLAYYPYSYTNKIVNVSCYIDKVYGDEMIVRDDNYKLRVITPIVGTGRLKEGEKVKLKGRFLYDPLSLSFYILSTEVREI